MSELEVELDDGDDELASTLAAAPLTELLARVATPSPAPGAGPAAAWTAALAAALLEMVIANELRREPGNAPGAQRRCDRALALRRRVLLLADTDVAAYRTVLEVRREGDVAGHAARLHEALSAAADPPLAIAEIAAEIARMASEAARRVRGGVRGEAIAAVALGEAAVAASAALVELNLGGNIADPRLARIRALAAEAAGERARA
jgi:methenyltetrahydrofolate cyclohydrolase